MKKRHKRIRDFWSALKSIRKLKRWDWQRSWRR